MDRKECEKQIAEKLMEIRDIYKQYNPKGNFLNLTVLEDSISFFNAHWNEGEDEKKPIDYHKNTGEEDTDEV